MVYQVGRPAMFDGKRFLPLTGMPILKIARMRVLLAVWLPEPLTVAATIAKSLTIGSRSARPAPPGLASDSMTLIVLLRFGLHLACEGVPRRAEQPAPRHPYVLLAAMAGLCYPRSHAKGVAAYPMRRSRNCKAILLLFAI